MLLQLIFSLTPTKNVLNDILSWLIILYQRAYVSNSDLKKSIEDIANAAAKKVDFLSVIENYT